MTRNDPLNISTSPDKSKLICNGCGAIHQVVYPASLTTIYEDRRAFREKHKDCFKGHGMTATGRVTLPIPQTEEEARRNREETLESYNLYLTNSLEEWERQLKLYITNRGKKEEG